jgi:hypothetical protein
MELRMRPTKEQVDFFVKKLHEGHKKLGSWDALSKALDVQLVKLMKWKNPKKAKPHYVETMDVIVRKIDALTRTGG